jgi:protein LTV1
MPRRKWISKEEAVRFKLVHRPQNDPLIHDESAPSMVLHAAPALNPTKSKSKRLGELASQIGTDALSIRDNEGEAANYGIFYDDSSYDYMQHMRDPGTLGAGAVSFPAEPTDGKGKHKQSLAEALRDMEIQDEAGELLDDEILPSKNLQRVTYQAQQDIPDSIRGFQPDMDPRLREVLEALDDDEYVDQEDDDIFKALAQDGQEIDWGEFEESYPEGGDEDGWESDDTAKPASEFKVPQLVPAADEPEPRASQDWLADLRQFQEDQKSAKQPARTYDRESSILSAADGLRRKKRKGALTSMSGSRMTAASVPRTEHQQILDGRYHNLWKREYSDYMGQRDETCTAASGRSRVSSVAPSVASSTASSVQGGMAGLSEMAKEFLASQPVRGKKNLKKGNYQHGVAQLDQIRRDLGPAKIVGSK